MSQQDEEVNVFDFFESEEEEVVKPAAPSESTQAAIQQPGVASTDVVKPLAGSADNANKTPETQKLDGAGNNQASPWQATPGGGATSTSKAEVGVVPKQRRDKRLEQFSLPEIYRYDMDANPKPWNENGKQDLDKYFNYGFNEETWKYHAKEMVARASLAPQLAQRPDLQSNQQSAFRRNTQLNFVLPHQFGGLADPDLACTYTVVKEKETPAQQKGADESPTGGASSIGEKETEAERIDVEIPGFDHLNLYQENMDLPQIKPRTINSRNEFYVSIPKLLSHEISKEEARRAIGRSVVEDYEQQTLAPLRQKLKERQEILKEKLSQLNELKRQMQRGQRDHGNQYFGKDGRSGRDHYGHGRNARDTGGKYGGSYRDRDRERDQEISSHDSGRNQGEGSRGNYSKRSWDSKHDRSRQRSRSPPSHNKGGGRRRSRSRSKSHEGRSPPPRDHHPHESDRRKTDDDSSSHRRHHRRQDSPRKHESPENNERRRADTQQQSRREEDKSRSGRSEQSNKPLSKRQHRGGRSASSERSKDKSQDKHRGGNKGSSTAPREKRDERSGRRKSGSPENRSGKRGRSKDRQRKGRSPSEDRNTGKATRRRSPLNRGDQSPRTGGGGRKDNQKGKKSHGDRSQPTNAPSTSKAEGSSSKQSGGGNSSSKQKQGLQIERKGSLGRDAKSTPAKASDSSNNAAGSRQGQQSRGNPEHNSNSKSGGGRGNNNSNERRGGKDGNKKHVVIQGKRQGNEPLVIKKRNK